jgi:hypothetical protein
VATEPTAAPPRPKVFISHSSRDGWIALQIARHVKQCKADCFIDKDAIQYGQKIDDEIVRHAKSATELLVLLTPWGIERPYVMLELGLFYAPEKRVVGVVHGLNDQQQVALNFGLSLGGFQTAPAGAAGLGAIDSTALGKLPSLLGDVKLVPLNDIESYFRQLKTRVKAWEASHAKKT